MEFKPQVIPTKNNDSEIPPFIPEKFSDWDPFNYEMTDICFSSFEEPREVLNNKIRHIQGRVNRYLTALNINTIEYISTFDQIIRDTNTENSIKALGDLMYKITDVLKNRLPEAEIIERKEWKENFEIKEVNQLVGYNETTSFAPEVLNIHILPNRTTPTRETLKLFLEGFQGIAKIVKADEKIKKIAGSSWIALEHPELIKKYGFKIEKNLKDEFKRVFIEKNKKKSEDIVMNRDEFLEKYLK